MKQIRLLEALRAYQVYNTDYLQEDIVQVSNDSRQIHPGACFIAIRGEHFDGHSALEAVCRKGAKMLVVDQLPDDYQQLTASIVLVQDTVRAQAILANVFYGEPSRHLNVLAVTGTNGKTTISTMLADLLTRLGRKTGLIGSRVYKIGDRVEAAVNTTPNSLKMQSLFHEMVEAGCQDVCIEASSHALVLGRLWYTDVDLAIWTNLSREHLDFHSTMDQYAQAKSLLFSQLGQQLDQGRSKLAIINLDDPYYDKIRQVTAAEIVSYSLTDPEATIHASEIRDQDHRLHFNLHFHGRVFPVDLAMQGHFNVSNYMAVFLTLYYYYGFSIEEIVSATQSFPGVPGRMQVVDCGQDFTIVVDFAHTSDALTNVFQAVRQQGPKRIISVMGHSGGNRDSGARPGLGDVLFEYSDFIVFTADNPRFEDVDKICREMIGHHDEKPFKIIPDRWQAVRFAIDQAQAGDLILFAGKGGEGYHIIGDEKIPYDDAEEARKYLKKKGGKCS